MTYEALERSIGTRETRYANAAPHLFPGAKETLRELVSRGDTICLWSNTYTTHLATAGIGDLRRELPVNEKGRVIVSSGDAKLNRLPLLFDHAQNTDCTTLVIVDDKESNLIAAKEIIQRGDIIFVRSDESRKESAPQPPADSSILTIVDFQELLTIRRKLTDTPVFWMVDFNDTIIDTRAFIEYQLTQAGKRVA